jgi:hypothetical protein
MAGWSSGIRNMVGAPLGSSRGSLGRYLSIDGDQLDFVSVPRGLIRLIRGRSAFSGFMTRERGDSKVRRRRRVVWTPIRVQPLGTKAADWFSCYHCAVKQELRIIPTRESSPIFKVIIVVVKVSPASS